MKIKQQDYQAIKTALSETIESKGHALYMAHKESLKQDNRVKDQQTRFIWDCFYSIPAGQRNPLTSALYAYLNDNHIETALKTICKELNLI